MDLLTSCKPECSLSWSVIMAVAEISIKFLMFKFLSRILLHALTCGTGTQLENPRHEELAYGESPPLEFLRQSFVEGLPRDIFSYTGLSKTVFRKLVEAVGVLSKTSCKLSRADQLMMCCMRLRLGHLYGHLARIFGLSVSCFGNFPKL